MRSLKHLFVAAVAATVLAPATASAISITIDSGDFTSLGSGWGLACTSEVCSGEDTNHTLLNLSWLIDPSLAGTTFTLDSLGDAEVVTFGTGRLLEEDNTIAAPPPAASSNETNNLDITAWLKLLAPSSTDDDLGVVTVVSGTLGDDGNDLSILFDELITVSFAGGEFTIEFSDPIWDCKDVSCVVVDDEYFTSGPNEGQLKKAGYFTGQTQTITATFTLTKLDTPVPPTIPEPASLALLGVGLAGLGAMRRRSKPA